MLERDLGISGVYVCPSVCLTHTGNDSKLMTVGSSLSLSGTPRNSSFFDTNFHASGESNLQALQTRLGRAKTAKNLKRSHTSAGMPSE